jgi:branched-chain amino acid transport system permease protein
VANAKLMIFGLALVLMMLLRPEGIFPSAQRRAEMRGSRSSIPLSSTNGTGAR